MDDEKKACTNFSSAARHFFGYLPGTGLKEFGMELKALTPADKAEIAAGLIENGYTNLKIE